MKIQYLEIVTPDVDAVCATYSKANGVTFGDPVETLGNARTAPLPDGGRVGVRAPMHDAEEPVTRPYFLVDDLAAATKAAEAAGAMVALPSMELPGEGTISIVIQGGIHTGFWKD